MFPDLYIFLRSGPDPDKLKGDFFGFILLMYDFQHCFICRPSDSTVLEDAGIEPRTDATMALDVIRSNHSAGSHSYLARSHYKLLIRPDPDPTRP